MLLHGKMNADFDLLKEEVQQYLVSNTSWAYVLRGIWRMMLKNDIKIHRNLN